MSSCEEAELSFRFAESSQTNPHPMPLDSWYQTEAPRSLAFLEKRFLPSRRQNGTSMYELAQASPSFDDKLLPHPPLQ